MRTMAAISPGLLHVLVPLIVLFALSMSLFYQARFASGTYSGNFQTFTAFEGGVEPYRETLRKEWRPRLFTNWMASILIPSVSGDERDDASNTTYLPLCLNGRNLYVEKDSYCSAVGRWVVFWFFMSGCLFIVWRRGSSLLYLFGSYAAVSMAYSPGVAFPEVIQIYPWDLPALFFFSLFVFLTGTRRWRHLFWALPLAVGFKETAILLCIAFLFCDSKSWKGRLVSFGVVVFLCLLVKVGIGALTDPDHLFFTMTQREQAGDPLRLGINVRVILRYMWPNTPFLVNAGTLLAFFLLPGISPVMRMMKTVSLLFLAGILTFGLINEFRIFFELIPVALYGLDSWLITHPGPNLSTPNGA